MESITDTDYVHAKRVFKDFEIKHLGECWASGTKCKDCECFLEYINFKGNLIEYKCLCCNRNYHKKFDKNLKKIFFHIYKFCKNDVNKFILLLQKGV